MTEWREFKLSDLIFIKHGYAFKGEFFSEKETPYILVTPGNFNIGGGFKSDKFKWYNGEIPTDYILKKDDLIVTMTDLSKNGDTLGYSALVPELNGKMLLHNQRIGLVEFKSNDIDKYFLYWLMRTSVYQKSIVNTASGSTVKHTSPDRICQFSFLLPPLDIQRKIAGILGALDDKIEVLRAQNKTLEQMAQAVFQSWFVDFDIVRAKAANTPTEDICKKYHITPDICALFPSSFTPDTLPQGWEKKKLGDVVNISSGKRPPVKSEKMTNDFYIPVYGGNGIGWYTNEPLVSGGKKVIITGRVGTLGEVYRICFDAWISDNALIFYSSNDNYEFLYFWIKKINFSSYNRGAAQPLITQGDMKEIECVYPEIIIESFHNLTAPYFDKIYENEKQIRTLEQTRDTLLPQLLNGKIDVENVSLPSVNDEV